MDEQTENNESESENSSQGSGGYQKPSIAQMLGENKKTESDKEENSSTDGEGENSSDETSSDSDPKSKKFVSSEEHENLQKALKSERRHRQSIQKEMEKIREKIAKRLPDEESDEDQTDENKVDHKSDFRVKLATVSTNLWKRTVTDAQEMFNLFDEHVDDNPSAWDQFLDAEDPGQFAYDTAKNLKFVKEYGRTPDEIEKKMKEKLLKENKGKTTNLKTKKPLEDRLPVNLSGSSRSGSGGDVGAYQKKTADELFR